MNPKATKAHLLEKLYAPYKECTKCLLKLTAQHNFVCGHGNPDARLMFVGEAPGKNEDEQGLPFVGKSGMLLTKTLACLDIHRENIFITNSVKCRPPQNRKPTPQECQIYMPLLLKEIDIIQPTVICTLGATALEALLQKPAHMSSMHGKELSFHGTTLIPTFHPAYILRDPRKFNLWFADLQKAWQLSQACK